VKPRSSAAGVKLDLEWTTYKDGILQAKVPEDLVTEEPFVRRRAPDPRRYPNFDPKAKYFDSTPPMRSARSGRPLADPRAAIPRDASGHVGAGSPGGSTGQERQRRDYQGGRLQNNRGGAVHRRSVL